MIDFSAIKQRQWYLLGGLGAFLVGGIVVYGFVSMGTNTVGQKQVLKSSLLTGSSRINPQEAWVYRFGSEAAVAKKRLDALEELLGKILKMNEASKNAQNVPSKDKDADSKPSPASLVGSIREDLKAELVADEGKLRGERAVSVPSGQIMPPVPGSPLPQGAAIPSESPDAFKSLQDLSNPSNSFRSKGLRKISLSLKNARNNTSLKTVDNTIPAGAFAKAVLLGGVDASASIQASSDPRPALLRITDLGTLPRKFRADLKGCHVLAACYGDISSERVLMRLERLTCMERKTGEIVEVKVQGYVAGEDGRTGVRGTVIDRAGTSMRSAMMGGFLSGVGEFLSQSRSAVTFSPLAGMAQGNPMANPMGMGEMLKHGTGKGVSNALDKYADFYIKRAEQVQPVIQVAAGRQVDIVFTEGVSMGDSVYRQALGRSNDQERYQQIQSVQDDSPSQKGVAEWTQPSGNPSQINN